MRTGQGILILESIPDEATEEKIKEFLAARTKNLSPEKLSNLLKRTPVILSRQLPADAGRRLEEYLKDLGAKVRFVETPEEETSLQRSKAETEEGDDAAQMAREKAYEEKLLYRIGQEKGGATSEKHEMALASQASDKAAIEEEAGDKETSAAIPGLDHFEPITSRQRHVSARSIMDRLAEVNKELWIIFTMVAVAGIMNYAVTSEYMILGLYTFPTILSAYFYGRRHAVMTATLTIILVGIMNHLDISVFKPKSDTLKLGSMQNWYHIGAWGCTLICTAYAMGTLYERHVAKVQELKKTYQGLIIILRHFISKDKYTENHCYRVSIYAAKIAAQLGLSEEEIDDIRSAGLLHDIGKLDISRELLYKAARLSESEFNEIKKHVPKSEAILEPVKGPLGRIIPIILAHHDKYDGQGYRPLKGEEIPLGARILAVADVYDALTSDRPYRKAMPPTEVKEIIVKGAGKDFDPRVVAAFLKAFELGEMEIPSVVV